MRIVSNPLASVFSLGLALTAPLAEAATVTTPITQITYIHSYTDFGSGDIIFGAASLAPGCDGFWLQPSDPGFKQAVSMLEMSKASQANVTIYAYDNQMWPGSASHFCKVMVVRIE